MVCWGGNGYGQLGMGEASLFSLTPAPVFNLGGATAVVAGQDNTCALVGGGAVECWGSNQNGDLGDGTGVERDTPVAVSGLVGATAIAGGGDGGTGSHACALLPDWTVACWGGGAYAPVAVMGLTGATAIAAGGGQSCAIVAGSAVECWADPDDSPVLIPGLTGATAIATTSESCAIVADGAVECWGLPWNPGTPVSIPGLTGAIATAGGSSDTCAIVEGGVVKCWDWEHTPVAVSGLTGALAIAVGDSHACAVVAGGTVKCWGSNRFGELGDGTNASSETPVAVSGLTGAIGIAAGGYGIWGSHSCALLSGGTVECWGWNERGELGNGFPKSSATPVTVILPAPTVPGAPTAVSATAGNAQALVFWSAPASDGGSPITGYTVTAAPGSRTCSPTPATSTTCTVTGLANGTPYTFSVSARNGVGTGPASAASAPVTPVAPAVVRRPDGRIRLSSGAYVGNNVYNTTGSGQSRTGAAKRGKTITFGISIQNDGTSADSFKVRATGSATSRYTMKYLHGSTDITARVVAGTFRTSSLAPGAAYAITARVTVKSTAAAGSKVTRLVTITSAASTTRKDVVTFIGKRS